MQIRIYQEQMPSRFNLTCYFERKVESGDAFKVHGIARAFAEMNKQQHQGDQEKAKKAIYISVPRLIRA
jgi:hypothetical protein